MIKPVALLLFFLIVPALCVRAQGIGVSETIKLAQRDSVLFLSHDFVVEGSLALQFDSLYVLQSPLDFTLDTRYGIIRLTPFFRRLLADTSRPHTISAAYRYRPLQFPKEYYHRRLVTLVDSTGPTTRKLAQEHSDPLSANSIFGRNFQRSGSIVRGFTIGSNRDLTLQSGLRLQFSGNITDDVEVLGALTDEQTPIQPEGNTQTLREVDNIFIEFRSPFVGATIGKFTASNTTSDFTAFSRKLQGARAIGRYGKYGSTEIIAAISPGKFITQQIQGQERNQGPYRLTGPNGERTIIVVAGTEHVYVDGVVMVRGQSNDYVIDYSTGEIVFQTRRPITSANRITVDFEYTDQQYSRSFIAASNTGTTADSLVTVTATYVRESDNPDATIDISLSDQDKALLAAAGGDRNRAVRSGVQFVGRADTLKGTYYRVDTLINGQPDSVFYYAPDDLRSVYNVVFTVVPTGEGDYRNVAFGEYEYAGKGLGEYLPVVYLPLPQLRQIGSLGLHLRPAAGVNISGEVGYSQTNLNRFSLDPAANKQGVAYNAQADVLRDTVRIGGVRVGGIRFNGSAQYINSQFESLERLSSVNFNTDWNTSAALGQSGLNDFKAEGALTYLPITALELSAYEGVLQRGSLFRSYRQLYSALLRGDSTLPAADYAYEVIRTGDSTIERTNGLWIKQRGGASYRIGPFVPGFRFSYENRQDRGATVQSDTLLPTTFSYLEFGPDLQIQFPFMLTQAQLRFRNDDSVRYAPVTGSRFYHDGASQTFTLHGELLGVRALTSTLDLTYRRKSYDSVPSADPTQRLDNNTILAKSQTRWSPFDHAIDLDALYDVQTQQAARVQRVFVQVPYGQGQYIWIDRDSNGVRTEDEFRLTTAGDGNYVRLDLPTDQLYPVINLSSSARVRLTPTKFFAAGTGPSRLFAPLTSETYLRLDEQSQDERESDIYLLRLSKFQNDSTTITGNSLLQQDFNLFETNPEYSFRLRYLDRRGLTKLVSTIERTQGIERSLRIRWQPTIDIGLQLDLGSNSGFLRSTDTSSTRAYDLSSLTATNDFSYRPEQSLELGWTFKVTSTKDVYPITPRTTFLSSNTVRAVYSIETRGRIRGELERTNVTGENVEGGDVFSLPYQLTDGYAIGTTWVARATFEYRFGSNIQASINYTGRAQPPSNRVIHTGQAEVRAFF